jgi:hypothetical protein
VGISIPLLRSVAKLGANLTFKVSGSGMSAIRALPGRLNGSGDVANSNGAGGKDSGMPELDGKSS